MAWAAHRIRHEDRQGHRPDRLEAGRRVQPAEVRRVHQVLREEPLEAGRRPRQEVAHPDHHSLV